MKNMKNVFFQLLYYNLRQALFGRINLKYTCQNNFIRAYFVSLFNEKAAENRT